MDASTNTSDNLLVLRYLLNDAGSTRAKNEIIVKNSVKDEWWNSRVLIFEMDVGDRTLSSC
jgi:hypothetical protein